MNCFLKTTASIMKPAYVAGFVILISFILHGPFPVRGQNISTDTLTSSGSTTNGSLVLYLCFGKRSEGDTVPDWSGYGNQGHIEGATWVADSQHGGAMRFDSRAQSQQVRVPNSDSLNPKRITIAAWIKASPANLRANGSILDKDNLHGYALNFGKGDEGPEIEFQTGQKVYCSQKYVPVADGQWHHVAVSYDGHVQLLYVDGKVHGKVYCWRGIVPCSDCDLIIGNSQPHKAQSPGPGPRRGPPPPAPLVAFDGLIGELRIYNRALNFKEIATLAKTWAFAPSVVSTLPAPSATGVIADKPKETFLHFRPRPNPADLNDLIQWIDIHNHFRTRHIDQDVNGPMQSALSCMKRDGTSLMIVSPFTHGWSAIQTLEYFKNSNLKYGGRFSIMYAPNILGSGSISNEQLPTLEQEAEEIMRLGTCGLGELFLYHLVGTLEGMDFGTRADCPSMLLLADIAARHDVPMDVHMDLIDEDVAVPPGITNLFHNMLPEFERLLSHNPKAKIIWEHVGSWAGSSSGHITPELCRRLLTQNPNLYMSLRIHNFRFCWTEEWQQLFLDFPDRFLIGRDCFYPVASDGNSPPRSRAGFEDSTTRVFLDRLPPDVARQIAYENAIKLFHLSDAARREAENENVIYLNRSTTSPSAR